MSRCIHLALVLGAAACEHANPPTAPTIELAASAESTSTDASHVVHAEPAPARVRAREAASRADARPAISVTRRPTLPIVEAREPERVDRPIRLMTRAGPRWHERQERMRVHHEPVIAVQAATQPAKHEP